MCEFVSYVKKGDHIYFLTHDMIYNTPRGEIVRGQCNQDDIIGHGAIRLYFDLAQDEGKNHECTDFSNPNNFPEEIVKAIKKGQMKGLVSIPKNLLRKPLDDKYQADLKPLYDKYQADRKPLDDKYQADLKPLDDKYQADLKPLYDKYWDLFAISENRNPKWRYGDK